MNECVRNRAYEDEHLSTLSESTHTCVFFLLPTCVQLLAEVRLNVDALPCPALHQEVEVGEGVLDVVCAAEWQ